MKYDYSRLRGAIREKFGTEKAFSESLGMLNTTLSSRLNNFTGFSQDEIIKSMGLLSIDLKDVHLYFFTIEVQKT